MVMGVCCCCCFVCACISPELAGVFGSCVCLGGCAFLVMVIVWYAKGATHFSDVDEWGSPEPGPPSATSASMHNSLISGNSSST